MQIIASKAAKPTLLIISREKRQPMYVRLNQCLITKAFVHKELLANATNQSSCITLQQILKKDLSMFAKVIKA